MNKTDNGVNSLDDIDYQLWVILDHLRYMIFKARRKELARYGVTPEQAQILYALGRISSLTINQMVEYTQHEHHSISTLINRMVIKGMVSKARIPGKGKKLYITITEKGQELLEKMSRDSISKVFTCLSEKEKQEILAHMSRLLISSYRAIGQERIPLCISELNLSVAPDDPNQPQ